MKSFFDFIREAVETSASAQAKRMGLSGNGHGDWYDNKGKLVAKTVKGQLKVFSGKPSQKKEADNSQRQEPANVKASGVGSYRGGKKRLGTTDQSSQRGGAASASAGMGAGAAPQPVSSQVRDDIVTVAFGKFNPPTKGHLELFKTMEKASSGGNYYIFPSRTQDNKRNPLDPELKISYMKEMFPKYADRIIDSEDFKTIFDVLTFLNQEGYTSVNIIAGEDRVAEIDSLTAKANGQAYQYNSINVVSSGPKDPDIISSSDARKAVAEGDFDTFMKSIPSGVDPDLAEQLFMDLMNAMNVKEGYELWQIAPDLDWRGLRENYITKNIFKVGSLVENTNTGLRGNIIRSGTNHLICVTNDGMMFKSWIKDVCEVHEIGTDEYREYLQTLTPGQPTEDYVENGSKINKRRKNFKTKVK
jgi:hypothetical protein